MLCAYFPHSPMLNNNITVCGPIRLAASAVHHAMFLSALNDGRIVGLNRPSSVVTVDRT